MNLAELRAFALSLPRAEEAPHLELRSARVGTRIFLTWPTDGTRVHIFILDEELEDAMAAGIGEGLFWGKKLAGLRVNLPADAEALKPLIIAAWRRKAPKRIVTIFDAQADQGAQGD